MRNDGTFCCVCGTSAATVWRNAPDNLLGGTETFSAVRCVRCGLIRLEPRPDTETMARAYAATTYARAEGESETTGLGERLNTFFERQAERANDAYKRQPGQLLDVGCGDGRFLVAMQKRGWQVAGLETDPNAAQLARQRTGATIYEIELEDAPVPPVSLDMVSLLHVLEHVPDPRETLDTVRKILKPGGMVLLALPNAGSAEAQLFGTKWYPLDLPRHYWGFTPHTLTRLLEECGFSVTGRRYFPFLFAPQSLRYLVRGAGVGSGANTATRPEAGGLRTRLFQSLLDASDRWGHTLPGEIIEMVAVRS